jgi:AcrR family transcriptional regulator
VRSGKESYHHGDLRNALVSAAARLIEGGQGGDFSLRETAREVGVSANAAYRHFEDKSALLTEVARSGFDQLSRRMQRAMNAVPAGGGREHAVARFKAVGRAYVEFAQAHPRIFDVMFGPSGASCITAEDQDREDRPSSAYELLGHALDELVTHGALDAAQRPGAELKAWSVVHGLARLMHDGALPATSAKARAQTLDAVLDFAVRGLCEAGARRASPEGVALAPRARRR